MNLDDLKKAAPKNALQRSLLQYHNRANPVLDQAVGNWQGKPIAEAIKDGLSEMALNSFDDAQAAKAATLIAEARSGGGAAVTSLNALRIETENNFLIPELRIIPSFFQIDNLTDNERPAHQNDTRQEVTVRIVSEDGRRGYRTRVVRPQSEELIDLYELATDPVVYALRDLYHGSTAVQQAALANIDLARDLGAKLDSKGYTFLSTLFGAFTLTGDSQDRVYVPHSYIASGNLPLTNDITLDATYLNLIGITRGTRVVNSGTTGIRQEVFEAITAYVTAWGECRPGNQEVVPSGIILCPSSDIVSIGNSLTLDGARGSDIAEQLKSDGFAKVPWLGRTYTLIPTATLPPKVCLVPFTTKIGTVFLKPSMDWEDVKTNIPGNQEERSRGMAYGMFGSLQRRPFGLRIRYRT